MSGQLNNLGGFGPPTTMKGNRMEALETKFNISYSDFLELEKKMNHLSERGVKLSGKDWNALCVGYGIYYNEYLSLLKRKEEYSLYASEARACGYEVEPFCSYAGLKDNYDQQRRAEVIWRIQNDPTW